MSDGIDNVAALEQVNGRTPPGIALKVIDHLDQTALHWISRSPIAFIGLADGSSVAATLAGGERGFASAVRDVLRLPLSALDEPDLVKIGSSFGSLFLVPGLGEMLRVNGTVRGVEGGDAIIAVEECYVHCAKALIRSDFWPALPVSDVPADAAGFVAASRFLGLATSDGAGTDLSPKGDPAGGMAHLDGDMLWFSDRPGNRKMDSFRNILARPTLAATLLVPGSNRIALVRGQARLTTDEAVRARFEVQGKVPLLAIGIEGAEIELRESEALARAKLWPVEPDQSGIEPAKMFAAHLKLNRDKGIGARIASAVVSIPGLMQKGLDKDYKTKLY